MNTKLGILIMMIIPLTAWGWPGKPKLVCLKGGAYIFVTTMEVGCRYPAVPYIKKLELEASEGGAGDLMVGIGYNGGVFDRNPNCDNPRGIPHVNYLTLPIKSGVWKVVINDQSPVTVDLAFGLGCEILD